MIKEIKYQNKAIKQLVDETKKLLNINEKSNVLLFQSPTGSGKTVMVAKYIKELIGNLEEEEVCFLWISIGKADLSRQSKEKLEMIFEGVPKVDLLKEEFFGYKKEIMRNEVVVVNWESINNRDSETGEWTNIAMRDGEKLNFRQVLANTRENRKIIVIIDESHLSATTDRAEELKNEIGADMIMEMSATPKLTITSKEMALGRAGHVIVELEDVINEEMIKKRIIINDSLGCNENFTIDELLIDTVYKKRLKLKKEFEEEGSLVNPLVVVQVPNSQEGKIKKDNVIKFLNNRGITNEKIAIWLSEDSKEIKVNLNNISQNNNDVEYIVFKKALDTGWDCPRAQILLKFREIQSETFGRQTLGRILRMPEHKHYINEHLNRAYIYTDINDTTLKIIDKDFDFDSKYIDTLTVKRKERYKEIGLENQCIIEKSLPIKDKEIKKMLIQAFKSKYNLLDKDEEENKKKLKNIGYKFELGDLKQNLISIGIDMKELLSENTKFDVEDFKSVNLDIGRIEIIFKKIIKSLSTTIGDSSEKLFNIIKNSLYEIFLLYFPVEVEGKELIPYVQRSVVLNYTEFYYKVISDVIINYKSKNKDNLRDVVIKKYNFEIPELQSYNERLDEEINYKKCVFDRCYLSKMRSKPEDSFEYFIQKNLDKVNWWYKNGDNGSSYFGIIYEYDGRKRVFHPDYLISFIDNSIGIYETKDKNDIEGKAKTKEKAKSLNNYIKNQNQNEKGRNLKGGIVANFSLDKDGPILLKINNKHDFYIEKVDEWEELVF